MKGRPLQDRILIKRIDEEETTKGGIIIPDTAKEKPSEGKVIAVGKGKMTDDGKVHPLAVKKGDRVLFSKYGGNMAEAGAVGWMFEPKGVIVIEVEKHSEDEIMDWAIEAGADDVEFGTEGTAEITTGVPAFEGVKKAIAARGLVMQTAELSKLPTNHIELDEKTAASVLRLYEALENHDDAQKVYANFSIADDVLHRLAQ